MAINRGTGMTFLDLVVSGLGPSCYVTHEPDGVVVLWGPVEDIRRSQESVAYLTGMGTASIVEDAVARMFLPAELAESRVPGPLSLALSLRALGGHLKLVKADK
jgi:hypothetical protein